LLLQDAAVPRVAPDVYLVRQGALAQRYGARVAEQLRDAGLTVVLHAGGGNFGAQMKKADASGARHAVIVGDDEAGAGDVSVKSLRDGAREQRRAPVAAAADWIKNT